MQTHSSLSLLLAAVLAAPLGASCAGENEQDSAFDADEQLAVEQKALLTGMPKNPMEPPTDGIGAYKLYGNQLSRLPVSHFFKGALAPTAAHHLVVRTECPSSVVAEYRDTGLYVVQKKQQKFFGWKVTDAAFNDDCQGQSGCVCTTCSRIDLGPSTGAASYDIYAFSAQRTRARCDVRYSTNGGSTWSSLSGGQTDLGGALVDVGAVRRGSDESFEVKTLESETSNTSPQALAANTHMLLFDLGGVATSSTGVYRSSSPPVFAVNQSSPAYDIDPKIGPNIPGGSIHLVNCQDPCITPAARHLLLIGKETPGVPTPAAARDIEATVDVIREPRDASGSLDGQIEAALPEVPPGSPYYTCSTPMTLAPGRYGASFRARSMDEYGDGDPEYGYPGAACPLVFPLLSSVGYENTLVACDPDYFYRGEGNWRALVFKVQALAEGDDIWRSRTGERTVANGGLGCRYGECWDTLREDFELTLASQVRVCVALRDPRIAVGSTVRLEKTPSFSELKVATVNIHQSKGGGLATANEYSNLSNLLATRGRLVPGRRTVAELAAWAPFEWAADIIMIQEAENELVTGIVATEAEVQSDLDWRWVFGAGKKIPEVYYTSFNSVVTHELLVPGGATGNITARDTDLCRSADYANGADHLSECYHEDWLDGTVITGSGTEALPFQTYSVPAKVRVRRWGAGGDTPILVYSVILEPHYRFTQRRAELESVIEIIKAHMAAQPTMSNAAGDPFPRAAGHRVIIAGDLNFFPHEVGEHRWFVRRLREEFGYAVDTAAADRDSWANFYDMHAFRGAVPSPSDGLPVPYTEGESWQIIYDLVFKFWWGQGIQWSHYFPYWATTYHGTSADYGAGKERDRHDAILLVGKGWANDDPVRKYLVMHTTVQYDSPFAIKDSKGRIVAVDIAPYEAGGDVDVPNVLDGRHNYAPQRPLSTTSVSGMLDQDVMCTVAGCAAIETDHIPVGVRLRVTR